MKKLTFIAIAILCFAIYAPCQETRAKLTGLITDLTGAIVPDAPVDVVNIDTGAAVHVKSNSQGAYTVPFLQPGVYKVSVQMAGFKAYIHTGLELQVQATVTENIMLQIGSVNESVVVTTATPMIDAATADTGQTLTAEEVQDLPNNGNSPFSLERNMYGVLPTNATRQLKPTDNTNANAVSIGGGQSASAEVLLNGVPNMESSSRQVSFIPQLDSVQTVHVDQFSANAAMGDTIGGTVNITTKSGTNSLHGSLTEYYNGSRPFTARAYFTPVTSTKPSNHYNQPGATIGGPVIIPKVFNGRNKLFFFYAWEGYYQSTASPTISSVPTQDERDGDFHSTLGVYGASAQLYDPYYAPGVTSTGFQTIGGNKYWIRAAIPNNCLTGKTAYCLSNGFSPNPQLRSLSPIAQSYLKLLPLPNYNGPTTKVDGENNYISLPANTTDYHSNMFRLDWNISDSDKIFGELHLSNYTNKTGNYYNNPAISGATSVYQQPGGQIDNVKTFSPSLSLETRIGYQRYNQVASPDSRGTSPSTVGFPDYIASNSVDPAVPLVGFAESGVSIQGLSSQTNGYGIIGYLSGYVVVNKTLGRHSLKGGVDVRVWKKSGFSPMNANGNYSFSASKTSFLAQSPNYAPDEIQQPFGSAFALMDLGLPSSGTYQITQRFQYNNWYSAYFLQDDWKARSNLTFSLGLRLDHETAVVESNNHMVQNWYGDQPNSASSPAASAYGSQYAANLAALAGYNPSYLPAPSALKTTGATVYETPDNRAPYHPAPLYVSPRIGFAYSLNPRLVIRGGFAIVNQPFGTYTASATTGYTQATSMVTTNSSVNGGFTPTTTWENPYPTDSSQASYNPIALPLGNTQGVDAALGSSLFYFRNYVKVPYTERFSLDIQKEFAHGWMAEIGAIHTLSLHNSIYNNINNFPYYKYLDPTPNANSSSALAVSNNMAAKVTNPFYQKFPTFKTASGATVPNTTALNTSSTIAVSSLLLTYPAFTSVSEFYSPTSTVHFNGLTARLQKRMSYGLEMNANFEWSRQIGATVQTNPGVYWVGETSSDYPVHLAVTAIYELPFGRKRQFMSNANKVVDAALGGWKVSGEYQLLSGAPISWGNVYYKGNFKDFNNSPHNITAAFNTSNFDKVSADQPGAWNLRTFPQYLLRTDPTNNFNFSALKDFVMFERFILTARVDAFNALNHAQMGAANVSPTSSSFGTITSQANTSRNLAGGLHLRF